MNRWRPHVTVAAVVERDGRFLLVEEEVDEGLRLNQPAGHLEPGESLLEAVVRETREETARDFRPRHVVGLYLWPVPDGDRTYLRIVFSGEVGPADRGQTLDQGILRTLWVPADDIGRLERDGRLRSPLVRRCIQDHLAGRRYPLEICQSLLPA